MIDTINIKNFKNIQDLSLTLDNMNVLVGSNNSGKSSILQGIQFAVSVAQTTNFENSRWSHDKLATSLTPEQLIYTPFRDVYSLAYGGKLKTDLDEAIVVELVQNEPAESASVLIRKGKNKNIATEVRNRQMGESLRHIDQPFSIYVPGLAGIPAFEELKSPAIVRRAAARGDANNVFRNIIWLLKAEQESWNTFIDDVRDIFPNVQIKAEFNKERDLHLTVDVVYQNHQLPIDAAGTGFLQIIQILSYINIYKPKLLLLDEPDAHLHPNNQRKLAKKLNQMASERNFQIIISTHSRHFLYELEAMSKINWISGGKLVEEEMSIINILMDLGALDKGDLFKNDQLKLIVLTEDEETTPIKKLIESSDIPLEEIDIWSYKGCSDVQTANVLTAFILKNAPNVKIAVHRDRDYFEENEIEAILAGYNADISYQFVTTGTDTESHFINAQHLHFAEPEISVERAQEFVNEALTEAREASRLKYLNTLSDKSLRNREGHRAGANLQIVERNLAQDLMRYIYGKKAFGILKSKIQRELQRNPKILVSSPHLSCPAFVEIKEHLWPAEQAEEAN